MDIQELKNAYPDLVTQIQDEAKATAQTDNAEAVKNAVDEAVKAERQRMKEIRRAMHQTEDPEELWQLQRRLAELTPILTQMNELADLTAHYYDRGYWRNEKYTL